ncbi:putative motility protein [bacterium]|nr:putative motility protein [bacterium]
MDISSAIDMAQGFANRNVEAAKLSATISQVKKHMDLQQSVVAQLLASLPDVSPEGVGGNIDITA